MARAPFTIGGEAVQPGARRLVDLPTSALANGTQMPLPVAVLHGRRDGPTVFVSGAIHGDEISGVAICRRLLASKSLTLVRGTLLVVPIVNGLGFVAHSRYLPDRRDLNRVFPGSAAGSLASRLAHSFLTEVVARSDFGVDLHSAAANRSNLPQIRVDSGDAAALTLAEAFGAPIVVHSAPREGSLRKIAGDRGIPVIVYEGGAGLRVDDVPVAVGLRGVLGLLAHAGMVRERRPARHKPVLALVTKWVRAEASGLFLPRRGLGEHIGAGDRIGVIADPYGRNEVPVTAPLGGIVIGRTDIPVVNRGDALFHVAQVEDPSRLGSRYAALSGESAERLLDEDEIV